MTALCRGRSEENETSLPAQMACPEARNLVGLVAELDQQLERPEEIAESDWKAAREAFEIRKRQLAQRLTDSERMGTVDDGATVLLRELL
jgi:hypothetical protein